MKRIGKSISASLIAIVIVLSIAVSMSMVPVVASTQLLEYLDIGNTSSEAGHNLQGWGLIEPATHGGNWGNISNPPEDGTCRVTWEPNPAPANESNRSASFTMANAGLNATELELRVLDGHANDSFTVYIGSNLVYSYICDPNTIEYWVTHIIDVSGYQNQDPLPVTINATGPAWGSHSTYGLLGIQWVRLSTEKASQPDLVITHKWVCWPDNCTICYNVSNVGNETAPAGHNTTLYVDGNETAHDPVPVLAPNVSYSGCFDDYNWTYTPPCDNITICADNNGAIAESNETNNCLTCIWCCGDVNTDGKGNNADVRKTFRRSISPFPLHEWAADVNSDGKINNADVRKVFLQSLNGGYDLDCYCEV